MIQDTTVSVIYAGDGSTKSFPFPYRYYDPRHVIGYVEQDGKWERITHNFEYHDDTKQYEYPTTGDALAAGVRLKLVRETEKSQEHDFKDNDVERALDKITMILQELNAVTGSFLTVGVGDFDGVIPAGRPYAFLRYNSDASAFEVVDLPDFDATNEYLLGIRSEVAADKQAAENARADIDALYQSWQEEKAASVGDVERASIAAQSQIERETLEAIRSLREYIAGETEQVMADYLTINDAEATYEHKGVAYTKAESDRKYARITIVTWED